MIQLQILLGICLMNVYLGGIVAVLHLYSHETKLFRTTWAILWPIAFFLIPFTAITEKLDRG